VQGERDLNFSKRTASKNQKPLRNDEFPDGFNWLSGSDSGDLERQTFCMKNTVSIAQVAIELSIAICIRIFMRFDVEKHHHSEGLFPCFRPSFISLSQRAHGGSRDK